MLHRLLLVFVLAAMPALPVAKEILQLQRDIALLQDQLRNLQTSFDKQLAVTQQLLSQNLEASNRLGNALAVLDKAVRDQEKVLVAPVANVNTRVDTLAGQFQALRDAVEEMNSKLSKLQQQVLDVKNIVSTAPAPTSAPAGSPPGGPAPTQPAAPPVSAETLFNNALRDYQSGNFMLAGPQFVDYIKFFASSERAADAQYYLGEIFYQQEQFDQAVAAFDKVLERFPEGKQTANAQYKKGMSLLKKGDRNAAAREFREVIRKFPRTPAATQAGEALKGLGVSARPASSKDSGRRK